MALPSNCMSSPIHTVLAAATGSRSQVPAAAFQAQQAVNRNTVGYHRQDALT
ncbi:hypothetical protein BCC0238_006961 [Burkholderia gladioli]